MSIELSFCKVVLCSSSRIIASLSNLLGICVVLSGFNDLAAGFGVLA